MQRLHLNLSLLAAAGLAMVCMVIPAAAQQETPTQRSGDSDNAPGYVDNADRQPYYVNGVEYKPYVPERPRPDKAAASSSAKTSAVPLHAYVASSSADASSVAASGESSSSPSSSSASSSSSSSAQASGPLKRPRYAVAVIQALDKITAETIRFEAPIGKPVRYKGLIYIARACETTAADEPSPDVMAYLEVRTNPIPATSTTPGVRSREIFHGWSFASSPSLNPIEHPNYDAWVIGCRQPLPGV